MNVIEEMGGQPRLRATFGVDEYDAEPSRGRRRGGSGAPERNDHFPPGALDRARSRRCYALFAQGVVLIYRGSGIVNFAQGALGMLASYITFLELSEKHGYPIGVCIRWDPRFGSRRAGVPVPRAALLSTAAPMVRLISTLGLLVVVQSAIELRYGNADHPVEAYCPRHVRLERRVRAGAGALHHRGHPRRHLRFGSSGSTAASAWPSPRPRRTSARCRRWAGHPTGGGDHVGHGRGARRSRRRVARPADRSLDA